MAVEAEGVLSFGTPTACNLAERKNWTPDNDVVRSSTVARRLVAAEHLSPWTLALEVTSGLAGRDEAVEMELEEWET